MINIKKITNFFSWMKLRGTNKMYERKQYDGLMWISRLPGVKSTRGGGDFRREERYVYHHR